MRVRKVLQINMVILEFEKKDGLLLKVHTVDRIRHWKAYTDGGLVFLRTIGAEGCPLLFKDLSKEDSTSYFKMGRRPPVKKEKDSDPRLANPTVRFLISKSKAKKAKLKYELKRITVQVNERQYRFLKYYLFFIRWASVKFGISQEDLEMGFFFYDENVPFSRERFYEICKMADPKIKPALKWRFWINEGLMLPATTMLKTSGSVKYYKISREFIRKLDALYRKIALETEYNAKRNRDNTMTPAMQRLIDNMMLEREEIRKGYKVVDSITKNVDGENDIN